MAFNSEVRSSTMEVPSTLVSDRDPIFTSHFSGRLLELIGIHANRSSAFHPQTDGQTEWLNSVLEQYLRMYCDYQQTDWASLLPMAEFSYNNSKHSATTLTPFYANYGFHPQTSLLPPSPNSTTPAADSYVQQLREAQVTPQRELLFWVFFWVLCLSIFINSSILTR